MIGTLVSLIVTLLILGLLFWLVTYLLSLFPLPDPFGRVIQAVFAVICILIVISVLTGYDAGFPVLRWRG
jgi:hypothetical protein